MVDRQTVACPAGHKVSTTLRGRSTTCGQCGRRVYVRTDGTTRHKLSRSAGEQDATGSRRGDRPAASAPTGRKNDAADWDSRRQIECPADLVDAAEYDVRADRTRLFDVDDNLIGWAEGNKEDDWPDDW
jgi:hypothetical protein